MNVCVYVRGSLCVYVCCEFGFRRLEFKECMCVRFCIYEYGWVCVCDCVGLCVCECVVYARLCMYGVIVCIYRTCLWIRVWWCMYLCVEEVWVCLSVSCECVYRYLYRRKFFRGDTNRSVGKRFLIVVWYYFMFIWVVFERNLFLGFRVCGVWFFC